MTQNDDERPKPWIRMTRTEVVVMAAATSVMAVLTWRLICMVARDLLPSLQAVVCQ